MIQLCWPRQSADRVGPEIETSTLYYEKPLPLFAGMTAEVLFSAKPTEEIRRKVPQKTRYNGLAAQETTILPILGNEISAGWHVS